MEGDFSGDVGPCGLPIIRRGGVIGDPRSDDDGIRVPMPFNTQEVFLHFDVDKNEMILIFEENDGALFAVNIPLIKAVHVSNRLAKMVYWGLHREDMP